MNLEKCERCNKLFPTYNMIKLSHEDFQYETICYDCFNLEMAEYYNIEDFKDFIKEYSTLDSEGKVHFFEIRKRIMGTGIFFEANEIINKKMDGYKFATMCDMYGNQHDALQKLYAKVKNGLHKKYIEIKEIQGQMLYSIKGDEIQGRIDWDDQKPFVHSPVFVIDGKRYTLEDFGRIMMTHEGFNFKLVIYDKTKNID